MSSCVGECSGFASSLGFCIERIIVRNFFLEEPEIFCASGNRKLNIKMKFQIERNRFINSIHYLQ